jgi:hypothetical protein
VRSLALLLLLPAACDGASEPEPMQCKELFQQQLYFLKADLDLLVVVGNASTMAEEQAALVDGEVAQLVDRLESLLGGLPDLHAAVMSDDAAALLVPDGCPALTDGSHFVTDVMVNADTGSREFNYTGDLGNQLSCMAGIGTAGDAVERPLASLVRALENAENGFRRTGSALAIAIVTDGDDASPDDIASYVERTRARAPASASVAISVVSGGAKGCTRDGFTEAAPAPRLAAFADQLGPEGSAVSLCGEAPLLGGLADALDGLSVGACIGDEVPSPADCRVSLVQNRDQSDEEELPLPSCGEAEPPCFSIAEDELLCPYTRSHLRVTVDRGGTPAPEGSAAIAACTVSPDCPQ